MRRTTIVALAAFLFLLNLWIARELLFFEYIDMMGSIEGTHIALGRWVLENWRDLTWFPLWYSGIPFQNTYPPLHPAVVAALAGLTGLSPAHAYHAATALFYSLGPVTLFLLAARLSRSATYSFAAALFYSLVSTSAFLIPAVRHDIGGPWMARRLQVLVEYGEGPHVASMTLLPLALLLLVVTFDRRRACWWFLAALMLASVVLTNWLGGAALAVAVAAWLLVRHEGAWWRNWLTAGATGVFAYAIASPWIPPSTIFAIRRNERYMSGELSEGRWIYAAAALVAAAALLWAFRRFRVPLVLRFSILFVLPMALITLASEWFGVHLMPQPHRYHLEMEMGLALVAAFAAGMLLERASRRARVAVACGLLALALYPALKYRGHARSLIRPIDVQQTVEYRQAQWFAENMEGRRVMPSGSIGFFLNVFTDVPQFAGGFDQGVLSPVYPHFRYQILSGENAGEREGEVAVMALKAFGVSAISVSGPQSEEYYKPFRNPWKFEGILPVLWREGDDVIYEIPRRSHSLAHVIRRSGLPSRRSEHGLDVEPLVPYLDALDDPALPLAGFRWIDHHSAVVTAEMEEDQIVSVQVSYHPGWRASVDGRPRRVYADHLGQLVVEPECDGPCTIELVYDGGLEMRVARILSWGTIVGGILLILLDVGLRRPRVRE